MNILIIILIALAMAAFNFTRINTLGWMAVWWVGIWMIFSFGIDPPLPSSIIFMFMGIVTIVLLAYLSSNSEGLASAKQTIVSFITTEKYIDYLTMTVVAIPLLVAFKVYLNESNPIQPPVLTRTIHPSPPAEIQFNSTTIRLAEVDNPFRKLESSNPQEFEQHLQNGHDIYFKNCVFCHGDNMKGDGLYAHGLDPIPADFADATTIAMLQEGYLFWRIAKGGPGLPEESTPWASAMPAWEKFLSEDEIWDVILFLYDYTDQKPRAMEEIEK